MTPAAQLGRRLFFDPRLSASGTLSCASCHDPANAYSAPAAAGPVMRGGASLDRWGLRSVPSLRYLAPRPQFARHVYVDTGSEREDVGPAGGYMLDGRVDQLEQQALKPLLDPGEMANGSLDALAARLRRLPYAADPNQVAAALAAFELEDPSFHPYSSRFDQYLAGEARLSRDERAGLKLFGDPAKGNCAACHTLATGPGGQAPNFTDFSYHALGVPRNAGIPANRDPRFFDLGLCGPRRTDLQNEYAYCGYFKTPTLRNVARRHFFFHNGRFTSLQSVLEFYVTRDLTPERWYPRVHSRLLKYDDLPSRYRANVDTSDAPLNRDPGARPALDATEIGQLIAFLRTLDDGD
ncbi:MAG TPA: cytochrome c peroxidase [Steroidobacteraceae bacterium]|nr:cytochrome c peroxidase [Steroidobacteraceae bacterium]